ncbi:hypothetical protein BDZ91DRAFT_731402, partial [Kalaharituber pfeilii]
IPSGPNIPSKLVHHCSQHSKSKSNSAAKVTVLAVAHTKYAYAMQAIYEPTLVGGIPITQMSAT